MSIQWCWTIIIWLKKGNTKLEILRSNNKLKKTLEEKVMKKKVVSLLICSALMMVEGVTTYAQTLSVSPADGNKTTIEAPSENKEQKK